MAGQWVATAGILRTSREKINVTEIKVSIIQKHFNIKAKSEFVLVFVKAAQSESKHLSTQYFKMLTSWPVN